MANGALLWHAILFGWQVTFSFLKYVFYLKTAFMALHVSTYLGADSSCDHVVIIFIMTFLFLFLFLLRLPTLKLTHHVPVLELTHHVMKAVNIFNLSECKHRLF